MRYMYSLKRSKLVLDQLKRILIAYLIYIGYMNIFYDLSLAVRFYLVLIGLYISLLSLISFHIYLYYKVLDMDEKINDMKRKEQVKINTHNHLRVIK